MRGFAGTKFASRNNVEFFSDPEQFKKAEREERQTVHEYIVGLLSVGSAWLITSNVITNSPSLAKHWKKTWPDLRKQIIKDNPWYSKAEDSVYKFLGAKRKPETKTSPEYTFGISSKVAKEYEQSVKMVTAGLESEISRIHERITASSEVANRYIEAVRTKLGMPVNMTVADVADLVTTDPVLARRYCDLLYTTADCIDSVNDIAAKNGITDFEKTNMHIQEASSISRGPLNRAHEDITYNLPTSNNPYGRTAVISEVNNPTEFFKSIRSDSRIKWTDLNLHVEAGYLGQLKLNRVDDQLSGFYRKLEQSLTKYCDAYGATTSMNAQLISYGGDHMGIRVNVNIQYTFGSAYGLPNDVRAVTKSIDVPLGNVEDQVHIGRSTNAYVGRIIKRGDLRYTAAGDYIRALTANSDKIARGVFQSLMDNSDAAFNMSMNEIYSDISQRLVFSRGSVVDRAYRSTIDDNINAYYPGHTPTKEERSRIKEDLKKKVVAYRNAVYSNISADELDNMRKEIDNMRFMIGQGDDIASRLLRFSHMLGDHVSGDAGMARIFWETAADHAGWYRYISVFQSSPWKYLRNPQTQQYQYWNVYDVHEKMRDVFPVRWGMKAPLSEEAFKTARTLVLFDDIQPYSDDEILTTARFKETMRRSVNAREPREIRIPRRGANGPVIISPHNVELTDLLTKVEMSAGSTSASGSNSPSASPSRLNIKESLASRPVILRANTRIASLPDGSSIRSDKWDFRVDDIIVTSEEIILKGDAMIENPRWRSSLIGKSTPITVENWNTIFGHKYSSIYDNVDIVAGGSLGRKMSPREVKMSVLMRVLDDNLKRIRSVSESIRDRNYYAGHVRINFMEVSSRLEELKAKMRVACRTLGARFDETLMTVEFENISSDEDWYRFRNFMSNERIDRAMVELGEVYTRAEAEAFQSMWKYELDTGKFLYKIKGQNTEALPDNVKEWMNKNKPAEGHARYIERITDPNNNRTMVGFVGLNQVAAMRQSLDDFFKVFKFMPNNDVGIPIKEHELQYLWHKYSVMPDHYREQIQEPLARYFEMIRHQMGGDKFAREYHKVFLPKAMKPLPGERIIDLNNDEDTLTKQFKELLNKTNIRNAEDRMYISPSRGKVTMEEAIELRTRGEEVIETPAYRTRRDSIGIFNPEQYGMKKSDILGAWLKLKKPTRVFMDGKAVVTEYLPIPDVMMMKHAPFKGFDSEGEYWIVPKVWDKIVRYSNQAVRGASVIDDYGRSAEDIKKEYFYGKESAFRTRTTTAYLGGLQGITMSGRSSLLTKSPVLRSSASILASTGSRLTPIEGVLRPTDIAISSNAFSQIEGDVRRLLHEQHLKGIKYEHPELTDNELSVRVKSAVDNDIKNIYKGNKAVPVTVTRHPVTGQHARTFSRMHVLGVMNKPEYAHRIMMGEMVQRAIWADYDFDLVQVALATHFEGWEAMEALIEKNLVEGQDMFYLASEMAADDFKVDIRVKGNRVIKVPQVYYVKNNRLYVHSTVGKKGNMRVLAGTTKLLTDENGKPYELDTQGFLDYLEDCIKRGQEPNNFDIDLYQKIEPGMKVGSGIANAMSHFKTQQYIPLMAQKGLVGTITAWTSAINMIASENIEGNMQGLINRSLANMIQDVSLKAKKWTNPMIAMKRFNSFEAAYKNVRSINDTYANIFRSEFKMTDEQIAAFLAIPIEKRRENVYKLVGPAYDLFFKTGIPDEELPSVLQPMYASMLGKSENDILKHLLNTAPEIEETEEILNGKMLHARLAAENVHATTKAGANILQELSLEDNSVAMEYGIKGRIDAVMNGGIIEEYKTVGARSFSKIQESGPMEEHLSQINFYMKAYGSKTGRIVYENRSDKATKIWDVAYDQDRWERDLAKYRRAAERAETIIKSRRTFIQALTEALASSDPGKFTRQAAEYHGLIRDLDIKPTEVKAPTNTGLHITSGYFKRKQLIGPLMRGRIDDTVLADALGKEAANTVKLGLYSSAVIGGVMLIAGLAKKDQFSGMGTLPGMGGEFWGPIKGSRSDLPWGGYLFGRHFAGTDISTTEHDLVRPQKYARIEMYDPRFQEKLAEIPGRVLSTIAPQRDITIRQIKKPNIVVDNRPEVMAAVNTARSFSI